MGSNINMRGRRTSWLISLIAIGPLILLAVMLVVTGRDNAGFLPLLDAFKTLSAIILSFLGGIRFGLAIHKQTSRPITLAATLLPACVGWASLFVPDVLAISLLLLSVCAVGAWDSFALHGGDGPPWLAKIRNVMTIIAAIIYGVVLTTIL